MLPAKKMSGSPSLSMSPTATPAPLYTYGSVSTFNESVVVMVLANVMPVCVGLSTSNTWRSCESRRQLVRQSSEKRRNDHGRDEMGAPRNRTPIKFLLC